MLAEHWKAYSLINSGTRVLVFACFLISFACYAKDRPQKNIEKGVAGCRRILASAVDYSNGKNGLTIPLFDMSGNTVNLSTLQSEDPKVSDPIYNICVNYPANGGNKKLRDFFTFYGKTLLASADQPKIAQEGPTTYVEINFTYMNRRGCLALEIRETNQPDKVMTVKQINLGNKAGYFVYEIMPDVKCSKL